MKDGKAIQGSTQSNQSNQPRKRAPLRAISAGILAAACSLGSMSAQASVISTSGVLATNPIGAYTLYNFEVTSAGKTTLLLDGNTDAWLGLFSGTNFLDNSTFIAQDDDAGGGYDSKLVLNLAVGKYTAWITT